MLRLLLLLLLPPAFPSLSQHFHQFRLNLADSFLARKGYAFCRGLTGLNKLIYNNAAGTCCILCHLAVFSSGNICFHDSPLPCFPLQLFHSQFPFHFHLATHCGCTASTYRCIQRTLQGAPSASMLHLGAYHSVC